MVDFKKIIADEIYDRMDKMRSEKLSGKKERLTE